MSTMFEKIKTWYRDGLWSKKRVLDALERKEITQEECDIILSVKD